MPVHKQFDDTQSTNLKNWSLQNYMTNQLRLIPLISMNYNIWLKYGEIKIRITIKIITS